MRITGLPYTTPNTSQVYGNFNVIFWKTFAALTTVYIPVASNSSTEANIFQINANTTQGGTNLVGSQITGSATDKFSFLFSGHYITV